MSSNEVRTLGENTPRAVVLRTCHYQLSKAGFMSMARFIGYIWSFNGEISRNPATYIEDDAEWQFTMDAELPSNLRS